MIGTNQADYLEVAKLGNIPREITQDTIERWYADRPEVQEWQQQIVDRAKQTGFVKTPLGRFRSFSQKDSELDSEATRFNQVAMNFALQGAVADTLAVAMVKLSQNKELQELQWKPILIGATQDLIFEGPQETAEKALPIIKDIMQHPHEKPLSVDLVVDAKIGKSWYEAKPKNNHVYHP